VEGEEGFVADWLVRSRACSRCVAGGVVSQAPIRRRLVRAAAMTMCPGPGLLSHEIERGAGAGSCRKGELTRGLATLLSHGRRGGGPASAGSISDSRCQARVSSLRAIAMVAIFFPRLLAIVA